MVNMLLPAYSRHFSSLYGAALATPADEMENQELEQLVLRERGVVWADQEEAGQQLKDEELSSDSQETNEGGKVGLHSELAPVLCFSYLQYHQSSPCSAERPTKRTLLCNAAPSPKDGGTQPDKTQNKPPRMPIRRNLSVLLPPPSPQAMARSQVFEDPLPLQCTPEPVQRTAQAPSSSSSMNLNMTFEVDNEDQTSSNATIIVSRGSPSRTSMFEDVSGSSQKRHTPEATRGGQFPFKRKHMAPLQDGRRTNPTSMGMKSAVQGKRKFNRSIKEDTTQDFSAPKRIKKDNSAVQRPLRVQRFIGSENRPSRVVRSVSEGNLNLVGAQKSRSFLHKTSQQIRRVVKQM